MKCERCGKEHNGAFGLGRFCSRYCANSRKHSKETKDKISKSLKMNKSFSKKPKECKLNVNILRGMKLAQEINLDNSPYSEYNTAFKCKLVGNRDGYKLCLYDGNKRVKFEFVLLYRFIVAQNIGRKLTSNEIVHHIDGNPLNNNLDNLMVMTRKEHSKYHAIISNSADRIKNNGGWNKGLKMSDEFRKHCSESAIKRWNRKK